MIRYLELKKVTALHGEEIQQAVGRVVEGGWYLQGEATADFEQHYARYIGVGIARGYEMLREAGFRYVTAYDHRVPRFEAL